MKLRSILTEMAWPDKFFNIEQKIRSANMTLNDFITFMLDEYNTLVDIQIEPNADAMHIVSAAITSLPIERGDIDPQAPSHVVKQLSGRRILNIVLGPGVTPNTRVTEIASFLTTIEHEMTHYMQGERIPKSKMKQFQQQYVSLGPGAHDIEPMRAKYTLQVLERSAQAVDLASYLAVIGFTPEQFVQLVNDITNIAKKEYARNPSQDEQDLLDFILGEVHYQMVGMLGYDNIDKLQSEGGSTALAMVRSLVGQLAVAELIASIVKDKEVKRSIRGQRHNFIKLMRKRFPKVKAYYSKHASEDKKIFSKNEPNRMIADLVSLIDVLGISG